MRDQQPNEPVAGEPDPSEIEPTDNSSGNPVDLQRLDDVTDEEEG
jgi:hypothetical protein